MLTPTFRLAPSVVEGWVGRGPCPQATEQKNLLKLLATLIASLTISPSNSILISLIFGILLTLFIMIQEIVLEIFFEQRMIPIASYDLADLITFRYDFLYICFNF